MANENAIELGAKTARRWFSSRDLDPTVVEYLYYGITVSQHYMFHSHNLAAAMLVDGKKNLPGLMVNQACTTSATCIHLAAVNIEVGTY
ncbi:MAG: thiolase family protein, partial [Deltaproteobacteria bacterium]